MITEELTFIRRYVGASPEDAELDAFYAAEGSAPLVARRILSTRLADMLSNPTSFSVDGYSQSYSAEQIKGVRSLIAELDGIIAADVQSDDLDNALGIGTATMYRPDRIGR